MQNDNSDLANEMINADLGPKVTQVVVFSLVLVVFDILMPAISDFHPLWPGLPIWMMVLTGLVFMLVGGLYIWGEIKGRLPLVRVYVIAIVPLLLGTSSAFALRFSADQINGVYGNERKVTYTLSEIDRGYQVWLDSLEEMPRIRLIPRGKPWKYSEVGATHQLVVHHGPFPFYVVQSAEFEKFYDSDAGSLDGPSISRF